LAEDLIENLTETKVPDVIPFTTMLSLISSNSFPQGIAALQLQFIITCTLLARVQQTLEQVILWACTKYTSLTSEYSYYTWKKFPCM